MIMSSNSQKSFGLEGENSEEVWEGSRAQIRVTAMVVGFNQLSALHPTILMMAEVSFNRCMKELATIILLFIR